MTRSEFLAGRLREVFLTGTWIANTNYRQQLGAIPWQTGIARIQNLNTIAQLTFHIHYYVKGLLEVLKGGELTIHDKYSFDLPPITSESMWKVLVEEFLHDAEAFADRVEQLDDALLDQPFVQEKYGTYLRNIEGVIEHSYYHLGQIALLHKILLQRSV